MNPVARAQQERLAKDSKYLDSRIVILAYAANINPDWVRQQLTQGRCVVFAHQDTGHPWHILHPEDLE